MSEEFEKVENKAAMVIYIAACVLFGALFGCWLRVFDVMAGRTLLTLAVYIGAGVTGVLIGALISLVYGRSKRNTLFFSLILLAAAGYHLFLITAVNGMGASWQNILLDTSRDFNLYLRLALKSSAIFILVFALLAGMAGMRAFRVRSVMFSAAWAIPGIIGFLAGCWLFGSLLIALCGIGAVLCSIPGLLGALALATLLASGKHRVVAVVVAIATAGAYVHIAQLKIDTTLSKGAFGRLVYRDSGFAFGDPVEVVNTLRHTISIYRDRDYHFVFEMDNRPVIFGSRYHTSRTLNAYLPIFVKPSTERVLLVGAEAGLYAPFLLRSGVDQLEYCAVERELIQSVFEQEGRFQSNLTPEFDRLNPGGFSDKYDLIMFTPEPAYQRGSAHFFSEDLLRKSVKALNKGGAVALHLDARAMRVEAFATILAGMRELFPHMQVWCTGVYDWIFLGANEPLKVEAASALELFQQDAVFKDFVRAGRLSAADVAASMVCDERGVDLWLEQHPERIALWKISWDAPRNVFAGVSTLMSPALFEKARQLLVEQWLLQGALDGEVYAALIGKVKKGVAARLSAVMAAANIAEGKPQEGLRRAREAAAVNPRDALLTQLSETLELEARRRIAIGDYKGAVRCYENILSFSKDSPQAHYGIGYCLRAENDTQNAYIHFGRAVVGAPEQIHYRLEFAEVAQSLGEFETADKQYAAALERNPGDAQIMMLSARALVHPKRADRKPKQAIELAKRACEVTDWQVAEAITGLADIYIEVGRVMEGMGLKRGLKEGSVPRTKP